MGNRATSPQEDMDDAKAIRRLKSIGRHFIKEPKEDVNRPLKVTVTGAAGQIGAFLCFFIAQGRMFGPYQKVILQLLELPFAEGALKGLVMELKDGAFPLVAGIVPTLKPEEAFHDADAAILVGAKPRGPGMERKDLLQANAAIFKAQGECIDRVAKKTIKVLVVGNPANTNALIASHYAPSIPKTNFTSLTRLDQNRAISQISDKVGAPIEDIKNIIIWGNHSSTQFPDVAHATITQGVQKKSVAEVVADDKYLTGEYLSKVQKRGAEIISVMKKSSAASAANAACDHMHDWWVGTKPGEYVSMGVITDGNPYGVAKGINYSFPMICKNGEWTIVGGLPISSFAQEKMNATEQELLEERKMALGF